MCLKILACPLVCFGQTSLETTGLEHQSASPMHLERSLVLVQFRTVYAPLKGCAGRLFPSRHSFNTRDRSLHSPPNQEVIIMQYNTPAHLLISFCYPATLSSVTALTASPQQNINLVTLQFCRELPLSSPAKFSRNLFQPACFLCSARCWWDMHACYRPWNRTSGKMTGASVKDFLHSSCLFKNIMHTSANC